MNAPAPDRRAPGAAHRGPAAPSRPLDLRRLDIGRFAEAGGQAEEQWPQSGFARLLEGTLALDDGAPATPVAVAARGELRRVTVGEPEIWLHLRAHTAVRLECQRCLQPLAWPLAFERSFRFVRDAALAERLDEESEDDVLALPRWLDLHELVEDELILALPIVPRHDACPEPLVAPDEGEPSAEEAPAPHPFAALAGLKRREGPG